MRRSLRYLYFGGSVAGILVALIGGAVLHQEMVKIFAVLAFVVVMLLDCGLGPPSPYVAETETEPAP